MGNRLKKGIGNRGATWTALLSHVVLPRFGLRASRLSVPVSEFSEPLWSGFVPFEVFVSFVVLPRSSCHTRRSMV